MTNSAGLHVVLGSNGGVGGAVARTLAAQGARVRAVSRAGTPALDAARNIETAAADLQDAEATRRACVGASVIYACANAPYHRWAALLPPLTHNALDAAAATGARLVVADNLYMYPPTTGAISEALPETPATRKGRIRATLSAEILAAHRSGRVRAVIGRAPDYYGPDAPNSAVAGERTFAALFAGRAMPWIGSPDLPHATIAVQDFAAALVLFGATEDDGALGQAWVIAGPPPLTGRDFLTQISQAAGMPPRILAVSPLLLRAMGLVDPIIREVVEMKYEFTQPYLVDGARFAAAFGFTPTPHAAAIPATVAWFQARYGRTKR